MSCHPQLCNQEVLMDRETSATDASAEAHRNDRPSTKRSTGPVPHWRAALEPQHTPREKRGSTGCADTLIRNCSMLKFSMYSSEISSPTS